jgi:hypothetical protein
MTTLDLDGIANKYAVYNGTSEAPLYDPMNNLPNLLWHSDLPYIGAKQTISGQVNLDPTTTGWVGTTITLYNYAGQPIGTTITYPYKFLLTAHGQTYAPFFLGYIEVNGEKLPVNGTFLYNYHMYNVSSDEYGIYLTVERLVSIAATYNVVCNFKIHILNIGTDTNGNQVLPPFYNGFDATEQRMQCGYFDTNNKYIIKSALGELIYNTGVTLEVVITQPKYVSATCYGVCILFKCNSYVGNVLSSNAQGSGSSFNPPYYRIAIT